MDNEDQIQQQQKSDKFLDDEDMIDVDHVNDDDLGEEHQQSTNENLLKKTCLKRERNDNDEDDDDDQNKNESSNKKQCNQDNNNNKKDNKRIIADNNDDKMITIKNGAKFSNSMITNSTDKAIVEDDDSTDEDDDGCQSLLLSTSPYSEEDDVEEEEYEEDLDKEFKQLGKLIGDEQMNNTDDFKQNSNQHSSSIFRCFTKKTNSKKRNCSTENDNHLNTSNSLISKMIQMKTKYNNKSRTKTSDDEEDLSSTPTHATGGNCESLTTMSGGNLMLSGRTPSFDPFPMSAYPTGTLPTHPSLFPNNLLFSTYCQQQILANARNALFIPSSTVSTSTIATPSSLMAATAALSNYMLQQHNASSSSSATTNNQLHPLNLTTSATPLPLPMPPPSLSLEGLQPQATPPSVTGNNRHLTTSNTSSSSLPLASGGNGSGLHSSTMMIHGQQGFQSNSKLPSIKTESSTSAPDLSISASTTTVSAISTSSTNKSSHSKSRSSSSSVNPNVGDGNAANNATSSNASSGSTTASNTATTTNLLCVVCGDLSSGKHYGILACNGCSGFFKRSVRRKLIYRCQAGTGSCIIDKQHRNQCQACRLKKCISMGMNKDAVQNERQPRNTATIRPEVLLSDSNPERLLREGVAATVAAVFGLSNCGTFRGNNTNSAGSNKSSNHHHGAPSNGDKHQHHHGSKTRSSSHNSGSSNNNSSSIDNGNNWNNQSTAFHHPNFLDNYSGSNGLGLLLPASGQVDNCLIPPQLVLNPESFYEICAGLLFTGVKWIKNLPSFATLTFRDQVILLEESWPDIFILNAIQWMMPLASSPSASNTSTTDGNSLFSLNNIPNSGDYLPEIRVLNDMLERFKAMNVDPTEFACLKALALFKPEARGLKDVAKIEQMQDQIQTMLLQQIKNHNSANNSNSINTNNLNTIRFGKLLLLLLSLKIIPAEKIAAIYFKKAIGNTTIEKLLCEMFKC